MNSEPGNPGSSPTETLLVIPTVGIQSSVKYVCGKEDYFVLWSNIDDVIINEVIKLYTKPRQPILEIIYSELQVLLSTSQGQESNLEGGDKQ